MFPPTGAHHAVPLTPKTFLPGRASDDTSKAPAAVRLAIPFQPMTVELISAVISAWPCGWLALYPGESSTRFKYVGELR